MNSFIHIDYILFGKQLKLYVTKNSNEFNLLKINVQVGDNYYVIFDLTSCQNYNL